MATPAQVLIMGNEQAPLDAVAAVLTHFWGTRTLPGRGALDAGISYHPSDDLVVLCDGYSEEARQTWVDAIRLISPTLLVVKLNGFDSGPYAGTDATVDYDHGPAALISTIYALLTERGLEHRPWVEPVASLWVQ